MAISLERLIPQLFLPEDLRNTEKQQPTEPKILEVFVASKGKTHYIESERYFKASSRMENIIRASAVRKREEAKPATIVPEQRASRNRVFAAAITLFTAIK